MKLMLTPTSGVPSEVTTCPRMTQAWLHKSEKDQHSYNDTFHTGAYSYTSTNNYNTKNNNPALSLLENWWYWI